MNASTFTVDGVEYPLATTLRVAYKVQAQNEHKPYAQVFEGIAEMPVEKQIDILYASITCANPTFESKYKKSEFCDYCLDNMNIKELLAVLRSIIRGIMGETDDDTSEDGTKNSEDSEKNV